ncbi:MAG: TetR/AcrR family transcriptional regulator [Sphingomonadales bacterium]
MTTGETQSLILDTATVLFNEHGVAAVSVNRIADAAGISRGNLHYHFPTKKDLIAAIFARMADEMEQSAVHDLDTPTLDHVHAMFERYVARVWKHRFFFRELTALTNRDPVLRKRYHATRERRLAELLKFFKELVARGIMDEPTPPVTIAELVTSSWIICDNWLAFVEAGGDPVTPDRLQEGYDLVMCLFRPYIR